MALEGTIQDFALPDIFQLIGIQRKTGLLTLERGSETVSLKFLEGQIVGADTSSFSIEDRLGELLVRTGRISEAHLQEALRTQKQTLRRLGHVLVEQGAIDEDELIEALRIQSSQTVYRLFRWREGTYRFTPAESLDYDESHATPISSETVLMEGARMMDEWPIIERRIRSDGVVLRLTDAGGALDLDEQPPAALDEIEFDLGLERDRPAEEGGEPESKDVGLPVEDRAVLRLVDGRHTVGEIRDLSGLGEFDVYRILADAVTRGLAEAVAVERVARVGRVDLVSRLCGWAARLGVTVLALASLALLRDNGFTPWRLLARDPASDRLGEYASLARLERLEGAIKVFYLDAGTIPGELEVLAVGGYVRREDLRDPRGRPIGFEATPGGYRLQVLDSAGRPDPSLSISRRFTAAQQMLGPAGAREPTGAP